jgi:ribose transport system permease protein
VILGGGLDLSVGSILALTSCTTAVLLAAGKGWPVAAVVGLVIGALAGLLNGSLITSRKLPPILTTLATLLLFRHGISIATHARAYGPFPDAFNTIGVGWIPLTVFIAVAAICAITCTRTRYGRWIVAIGGSEQSALLSAVPVARVKRIAYLISGLCAGLSGWIVMAFNNNAQSSVGQGYELDVIAACVVGGIRITGGDGSVVGAAMGAILIALLRDALILTGRPIEQYGLFTCAIILVAALLEGWRSRRKARAIVGAAAS